LLSFPLGLGDFFIIFTAAFSVHFPFVFITFLSFLKSVFAVPKLPILVFFLLIHLLIALLIILAFAFLQSPFFSSHLSLAVLLSFTRYFFLFTPFSFHIESFARFTFA